MATLWRVDCWLRTRGAGGQLDQSSNGRWGQDWDVGCGSDEKGAALGRNSKDLKDFSNELGMLP